MPGPPRSKGCYRCREKKIKCDEGKPSCKRCQNVGVQCPGYRPEKEIRFRDMNTVVKQKISGVEAPARPKRASRDKSGPRPEAEPTFGDGNVDFKQEVPCNYFNFSNMNTPLFPNQFATDWNHVAICQLRNDFIRGHDALETSQNHWSGFPKILASVPEDNVCTEALNALALVYYSNQAQSTPLLLEARKHYGRALVKMQHSLLQGAKDEAVLAGMVSLNVYELFSGDQPPCGTIWETHSSAMSTLLQETVTVEKFASVEGGSIYKAAHMIVTYCNLFLRQSPGPESELYELAICDSRVPSDLVMLCSIRISRLLPLADMIMAEGIDFVSSDRLLSIIQLLQEEDTRLEAAVSDDAFAFGFDESITLASSHWLSHRAWVNHHATRAILLQTLTDVVSLALQCPEFAYMWQELQELHLAASTDMYLMVSNILERTVETLNIVDSTPDLLSGRTIAVHASMWPLMAAQSIRTITVQERQQLGNLVVEVQKRLGPKHHTYPTV